jgi:integrase
MRRERPLCLLRSINSAASRSATILKSHGEDVKTVQELLRHANKSITLNLYAQAVTDIKRSAQSRVARLVFKSGEESSK